VLYVKYFLWFSERLGRYWAVSGRDHCRRRIEVCAHCFHERAMFCYVSGDFFVETGRELLILPYL
jgi:hypothetical protein